MTLYGLGCIVSIILLMYMFNKYPRYCSELTLIQIILMVLSSWLFVAAVAACGLPDEDKK